MNIREEYFKCLLDKSRIYMIENFLQTMDSQQGRMVPFHLFPRQKDYLWNLHYHNKNITTKPRQSGITTCTAAKLACEIALSDPETPHRILLVANKLTMSKDFLAKVKEFIEQLPRWFWGDKYYHPDETHENNLKSIYVSEKQEQLKLFNNCIVRATASGPNAARGFSGATWVCFDEAAFIENGASVATACIATGAASGDNLHVALISTPNGKDELYYTFYNGAKQKKNGYHITEFRWYQDPRFNKNLKWFKDVSKTDANGMEYIDRQWKDNEVIDDKGNVKYDLDGWWKLEAEGWKPYSDWYQNMCESFNNNDQQIAQELDVSFLGSDFNVVNVKTIKFHETINVILDPLKDVSLDDIWIWKEPIEGHEYIMSVDASRGDSEDSSVIQIIDITAKDEDGLPMIEQVMEYQGKISGDVLGGIANNYGLLYNEAFCIIDCCGGYGDLAAAAMVECGYKNFYYNDPSIKDFTATRVKEKKYTDDFTQTPGFKNTTLRPTVLLNFANALVKNEVKIRSIRVIRELETWVYKNGRPDHKDGAHDDTITALALAWFIYLYVYKKIEEQKKKDKTVIEAWKRMGNNSRMTWKKSTVIDQTVMDRTYDGNLTSKIDNENKIALPFYNQRAIDKKTNKGDDYNFVWLFYKNKR